MEDITKLAHSPLGASSADRWMTCPGSIGLGKLLDEDHGEGVDQDWRTDGTTAHAGLAKCLETGVEGWELEGQKFEGREFTAPMRDAVDQFLKIVGPDLEKAEQTFIETKIKGTLHEAMMGTVDLGYLMNGGTTLKIRDFKYGVGVTVPVKDNPQVLYYAYLLLEHPDCALVQEVDLMIIQPRDWRNVESGQSWVVSADYVRGWGRDTLLPAMLRTGEDSSLIVGGHCRFCPARLVCPAQGALFEALIKSRPDDAYRLADAALEQNYQLIPVAKMYLKALEDEMMRRAMNGTVFWKNKLVNKTADRVWKDEAEAQLKEKFGGAVYSQPKLASPAVVEKLSPTAKALVKRLAYTPQTGYTLADMDSKKPAVKVQPASVTFAHLAPTTEEETW
jgi:hypothetical protein